MTTGEIIFAVIFFICLVILMFSILIKRPKIKPVTSKINLEDIPSETVLIEDTEEEDIPLIEEELHENRDLYPGRYKNEELQDYFARNLATVLVPDKMNMDTLSDEELQGKIFSGYTFENCLKLTIIDADKLPVAHLLPKDLVYVIAKKFGLYNQYDEIDYSKPISHEEYKNFIKKYDIKIQSIAPQSVSMVSLSDSFSFIDKCLKSEEDVDLIVKETDIVDNRTMSESNLFPLKYVDGDQLYVKYTKNRIVWDHYDQHVFELKKVKSIIEEVYIMTGEEFITWYNKATDDIMKLIDDGHEESSWTLLKN